MSCPEHGSDCDGRCNPYGGTAPFSPERARYLARILGDVFAEKKQTTAESGEGTVSDLESKLREIHDDISSVEGCSDYHDHLHRGNDCGTMRALRTAAALGIERVCDDLDRVAEIRSTHTTGDVKRWVENLRTDAAALRGSSNR